MAKRITKLTALLMAIVMMMGTMSMTAFATEGEAGTTATEKVFPINKTANGLDANDQTDVTLTVPGTIEGNIDVVFILGGGMTANMETIESAINVFKPVMENGKATVRMGLISLEKGKEIILDLNSDEAVLDPATYVDFVTEKFDSINDLPYGTTNLHSQMLEAQKMLAKETKAKAENKYVFVLATGRTYWFDDAKGEQATIVNKVNGTYYWGDYLWKSQRGRNTSLYMLPDRYNNSYEAFFADVEKWVAADGDTYVYTPHFDVNDYGAYVTWEQNNNKDLRDLGVAGSRYGNGIVNPVPTAENFITGTPAAIGSENHPLHALNYERAQYECIQVWKELIADGYNCYSICSESPNYQNGSEYIKGYAKYTGTSTSQVGHSFMNYLAELAGQEYAPTVWDYERDADGNMLSAKTVLQKDFFDAVRDDMLYTVSKNSTVVDYIGKNKNGNFEFIEDKDVIKLNVAGVDYITSVADTAKHIDENGEEAKSSYAFTAPVEGAEPTFWLDYFRGDGETTERFVWTFGENVSLERLASLTYKLQLTEKQEEAGEYTVPTNNSATLYPKDSDGKDRDPQVFPVPEVEYEVVPYDVDIVLALGAGIAQYDADSTKGTNTYDSIVSLVEPLVNQGINVKLGLVAVEHYDDEAMPLTELTKDNYKTVITEGLNKIQSMPAGPTNLEGNILAAKAMLDADTEVPAANKFFYVIATGRTYCFDDANGVPATIINKVALKGADRYYWGHYLWQSQRGRHTSLYMIPDRYNDSYEAFFADIEKWVGADKDTYVYTFPAYDTTNQNWYVDYYGSNTKDAKALGLASSRFGWIFQNPAIEAGTPAIGSGANPANALNYERGQYDAYQAFNAMKKAGYNCYALCSESTSYQNGSPYIKIAKYTGTSTSQLGHSFMNFLNGGEAPLLFVMTDPNTGASKMAESFYAPIDMTKLVMSTDSAEQGGLMFSPAPPMMSPAPVIPETPVEPAEPEVPAEPAKKELAIITQPADASAKKGEEIAISVVAEGEGLKYQWYIRNAGGTAFSKSSITEATYSTIMNDTRNGREIYCVITDADGNKVTSETAFMTITKTELKIITQPVNAEGALGAAVSATVEAQGDGLKYAWYFRNANGTSFSKSSITSATYSTTMDKTRAGREIYCVITDAYGNKVTTDTVKLIRVAAEELKIVEQPVNAEAAIGEAVSVAVKAQGEGLKYVWYFRNANGTSFSKSSITSATYSTTMDKTRAGREVYCVITDAMGNQVTTDTVKLIRVAAEELEIVKQPESVEVAKGSAVSIKVEAKGEGLKYVWYFRNAGTTAFYKSSITSATYSTTMDKTRAGREVYCVITDALGNQVTTDTVQMIMSAN